MPARTIDGIAMAAEIREELRPRIARFTSREGRPPGLGIVLAGDDPGSEIYVRNKLRSAAELGMRADLERLPVRTSLDEIVAAVHRFNASDAHDAILVQSPLPEHLGPEAEQAVFDEVDPDKDVDGFHPENVGKLVQKRPTMVPATPLGIVEMLVRSGIPVAGQRAVVIGRSDIVGKPVAMLLLHRDATVTVCHSKTKGLEKVAAEADILVAAIGRPAFVTPDFVKPGAAVVDVGINRVDDAAVVRRLYAEGARRRADFERKGSILVGDVHPEVAAVAGHLTPVPGGVGPMTIAMLLSNTVLAAERRGRKCAG
ncbi:MAG: bifunctional 5,10-methylenetetrahydrofolate dehydrogenase/5,10-methenyltetrahydrofolate cyclohydrolase [Vicinamibacterales bacterium]